MAYPGSPVQPFQQEVIDIETAPNGGGSFFHGQFQVRFRSTGGSGAVLPNDDWFVDDVHLDVPVSVEAPPILPTEYAVSRNYPNPFNPATTIEYQIPEPGQVSLVIYNMLGQDIRTLLDGPIEAGYHKAVWDGTNDVGSSVASGIYVYRFQASTSDGKFGDFLSVKKMVMLK
jgi:hypothetical protein